MSAPADRPLSALDSLRGLLAAFRLLDARLGIDLDATTIRISTPGPGGRAVTTIGLRELLDRADAAVAADGLAQASRDMPGAHSPLPWTVGTDPDDPAALYDALGTRVFALAGWEVVPADEAAANVALVARAVSSFPLLVASIDTAVHALRSYQNGNSAPDLAREIADACEVVVAQVEGR